ncbi:hypothetical protein F2Q70_00034890 [Brassica cretica]|uniref:Gnk2-homologous domain-containing protein n=1 Tax=Brassica cretica TaxID=69181 RepID=A0A8S9G9W9_BRACR|nr:hypothetical protein F2Q68_00029825 [Brassica cretica]KAF2586930.1 hypothetical protein F2Q70_00034890 [Brassica cretica]
MNISTTNAFLIKGNITLEVSTRTTSTGSSVNVVVTLMSLIAVHALTQQLQEKIPIKTNYKNIFSMHNPNNVRGDAKLFAMRAKDFLSELILKVEKTTKYRLIFYSAGEKKLGKNKLYAMVQCLDLRIDCKRCLAWSITKLFKNDNIKQGARVLGTDCNVRYELYPFLRS